MSFCGVKITATNKEILKFTFTVPPITNQRKQPAVRRRKDGTRYVGIRITDDVKAYQNYIRNQMLWLRVRPLQGELAMHILWYRKRRQGDVIDRWKDLCDAMQAKVKHGRKTLPLEWGSYYDDDQVKSFGVDRDDTQKDNPRIVVTIAQMEDL